MQAEICCCELALIGCYLRPGTRNAALFCKQLSRCGMHCVLYLAVFVQLMLMPVLDLMMNCTFAANYMLRYYKVGSRDEVGKDIRRSYKVSAPVEPW